MAGRSSLGLTPPLADDAEEGTLNRLLLLIQHRLGLRRARYGTPKDHRMLLENLLTLYHAFLTLSRPTSKF